MGDKCAECYAKKLVRLSYLYDTHDTHETAGLTLHLKARNTLQANEGKGAEAASQSSTYITICWRAGAASVSQNLCIDRKNVRRLQAHNMTSFITLNKMSSLPQFCLEHTLNLRA